MTSNQVTNSQITGVMGFVNSPQFTGKVEGADFSSFMADSSRKVENEKAVSTVKDNQRPENKLSNSRSAVQDKAQENNAYNNTDDKKVSETRMVEEREPMDSEVDALKEAVNEIAEAIKKTFGVTDEELADALAVLNMDMMSLLIPENMQEVSVELAGAESTMSLVTDAKLYEDVNALVKELDAVLSELETKLDIPVKEIQDAINAVAANVNVVNVEETGDVTVDENENIDNIGDKVELINPETKAVRNFSIHNEAADGEEDSLSSELGRENTDEQAVVKADTTPVSFAEALIEKTKEVLNTNTETVSFTSEQTEMIMNQITERIKVEISPETTEINLKLHPETLGNVSVRVSQNSEGVLTAQFNAQNEGVKAVIEAQAIVLKETLEAKGITVEAVEVMVGSHEFERNLSDEGRQNNSQQQRRNGIRRINLDTPDEETELDDEDIIQKEIMRQNGNTIDYTA